MTTHTKTHVWVEDRDHFCYHVMGMRGSKPVTICCGFYDEDDPPLDGEDFANAKRVALTWNNFEEAVEILKKVLDYEGEDISIFATRVIKGFLTKLDKGEG